MSDAIHIRGLGPVTLRGRQRVGGDDRPWTDPATLAPGLYVPPMGLRTEFAAYFPVAYGGLETSVPDLDAISVTITRAAGPAPLATGFQLRSSDPNFAAFVAFGTARWIFSQHGGESYAFRSLAADLAGDTAGTATGPFVAHVYVTGPGRGVATPVAHQWSVELRYPGLPPRTITWEDGASDLTASEQATYPRSFVGNSNSNNFYDSEPSPLLPCGAVLVHDPDVWFAGRTVWYSPAHATVDDFYDAMLALETASPGSSDIYGWSGRTAAEMKALMRVGSGPGALRSAIAPLNAASRIKEDGNIYMCPIGQGWRFLILAGTTYVGSLDTDTVAANNIRVDRFGAGADPVIDFSSATTDFGQAIAITTGAELMNLKLVGPYDAANPPWLSTARPQLAAHGVKSGDPVHSNEVLFRLDIGGFNQQVVASYGGRRGVIADCHVHNWYNYGMFPQPQSEGGIIGCRIAQKPGTVVHPRYYDDNGGGNNNDRCLVDQTAMRATFSWAGVDTRTFGTAGSRIAKPNVAAPSIPAEYHVFDWSGGWGTHPAGEAGWSWWAQNWMFFFGWSGTNEEALLNGWLETYRAVPIHGPLRFALMPARMALHQCELVSLNGWSVWMARTNLRHPVTGRWDVMQDRDHDWFRQETHRLVTHGTMPRGYTTAHAGLSCWRIACYGQGPTLGLQTAGSSQFVADSTLPFPNIVLDGYIVRSPHVGVRLGPAWSTLRNSLIVLHGTDTYVAKALVHIGGDVDFYHGQEGVDPLNHTTPQKPHIAYNVTCVLDDVDMPLADPVFAVDTVSDPADQPLLKVNGDPERRGRRLVAWNIVGVRSTASVCPQPDTARDPDTTRFLTSATAETDLAGALSVAYAPLAGSNLLAAAQKPVPHLDIAGAVRPAAAALGAFEAQSAAT